MAQNRAASRSATPRFTGNQRMSEELPGPPRPRTPRIGSKPPIRGTACASCAAIGVVVSVATTYIVKKGICSGGRKLWWYDVKSGSTVGCRSSAPF